MINRSSKVPVKINRANSAAIEHAMKPISSLREIVDHLFDEFRDGWPFGRMQHRAAQSIGPPFGWAFQSPAIDFIDRKKDIRLKAELPSMDKKDLEVRLTDRMLTISGEKKEEGEEEKVATRGDHTVTNLLHETETQVIRLIENHCVQILRLVSTLEIRETLDIGAIKSFLEPGSTFTPIMKNRKRGTSLPPDTE